MKEEVGVLLDHIGVEDKEFLSLGDAATVDATEGKKDVIGVLTVFGGGGSYSCGGGGSRQQITPCVWV